MADEIRDRTLRLEVMVTSAKPNSRKCASMAGAERERDWYIRFLVFGLADSQIELIGDL